MITKALDAIVVLSAAALLLIAAIGGIDIELGSLRVRLHGWTRPLVLLVLALSARGGLGARSLQPARGAKSPSARERGWGPASTEEGATGALGAAYLATRGLVALLVAIAAVYAHAHVRVAGGLDSYGYVSASQSLAAGRIREAQPLAALLPFGQPMDAAAPLGHVPSADGRFSVPRFPLGLPAVMAVFTIFGPTGPFFVPLAMAFGAIILAYRLGCASWTGERLPMAGLVAAALVAADPLFAAYAIQPMSDVPATFWMLAAVWAAQKGRPKNGSGADPFFPLFEPLVWSVIAGICAGMAVLTRPALLPAVAVLGLVTADRRAPRAALAFGTTVGAFVALQFALNVALYGGAATSGYGSTSHMFELSLSRLSANASNFGKWLTYSHTAIVWLLWPAALFVLRREKSAWQLSAVAAAAGTPYLFYIVFDDWESSRFLLPAIALVLILSARAVVRLFQCSATPRLAWAEGSSHLLLAATVLTCAAASHRFLEREGTYRLHTLEAKYALVGEWFRTHTSERAVVLASLHSGSIRLYGNRATLRWDQIPEQALDPTVSALIAAGYDPFLALDQPSEPALFRERFGSRPVNMEPVSRVRVVDIYRLW